MAKQGVLPTRLSAVDEAASITILCSDKTGTLTQNALTVTTVRPMPGFDEAHVLALAALASSDGGQDPVDGAIRMAAASNAVSDAPELIEFTAFDPAKKMSEATATDSQGNPQRIVKGAFATVIGLAPPSPDAAVAANELEGKGFRVLAVAAGRPHAMKLAGLIALSDPPRADSAALVSELHGLGVRTVMVTGDALATAAIVAKAVGLDGAICPPGPIPDAVRPEQFAVFAGVLPEDKYKLVKAFQTGGHIVGMCGDGANDAPALRQAQMGIAVSTATDVAKSAAGMVLTEPGLAGIVAAVKEGRVTFQRIMTYTLNSIVKKIVTVLFLIAGLIMTGHAILTPLLMVIVMITGDFLTMSLTTDNVQPSPMPNTWRHRQLDNGGRRHGHLPARLLHRCASRWQIRDGPRYRSAKNPRLHSLGVRESGGHLCHSPAPAFMGLPSEPVARGVVSGGYRHRFNISYCGNRHDISSCLGNRRHACCGGCLRVVLGHGEGSGIRSSRHRLGRHLSTGMAGAPEERAIESKAAERDARGQPRRKDKNED